MSQEVFCIHCGSRNPAEAAYCMSCGGLLPRMETDTPAQPTQVSNDGELKCPYCDQVFHLAEGVTQLICIQCAASYEVKVVNGVKQLEILRFV